MHEHRGKSFLCPIDKKMISPHIEWCIRKGTGLYTVFVKISTWAFSRSCLDFWGNVDFIPFL